MHYKPVKEIDALGLAKVILNVVVWYHGLPNSIISDKSFFFTLKFRSLLYYLLGVKQQLPTAAILRHTARLSYKTAR